MFLLLRSRLEGKCADAGIRPETHLEFMFLHDSGEGVMLPEDMNGMRWKSLLKITTATLNDLCDCLRCIGDKVNVTID